MFLKQSISQGFGFPKRSPVGSKADLSETTGGNYRTYWFSISPGIGTFSQSTAFTESVLISEQWTTSPSVTNPCLKGHHDC